MANDHLVRGRAGRAGRRWPTRRPVVDAGGRAARALERDEAAVRGDVVERQSVAALVTAWRGGDLARCGGTSSGGEREAELTSTCSTSRASRCGWRRVARPARVELRGQSRTPSRSVTGRPAPVARPDGSSCGVWRHGARRQGGGGGGLGGVVCVSRRRPSGCAGRVPFPVAGQGAFEASPVRRTRPSRCDMTTPVARPRI